MTKSIWDDPKNVTRLIEMQAEGLKYRAIGDELGVSKNAIVGKLHGLGIYKVRKGPSSHKTTLGPQSWSIEHVALLKSMWRVAGPLIDIAKSLGRSTDQIWSKAYKIGLGPRPKFITLVKIAVVRPKPKAKPLPKTPALKVADRPRLIAIEPAAIHCVPVTLENRTGCCYPTNNGGPFLFCNNAGTTDGDSIHCDPHWALTHERRGHRHHGHAVKSAHRAVYR